MINIISYNNVNGVPFGASENEAIAKFGSPREVDRNSEGELELHYADVIFRFTKESGQLRECTLLPGCESYINGRLVSWGDDFLVWLSSQDSDLKQVGSSVLSLKLGLSLNGFHDADDSSKAIHAFNQGDWDMFHKRMRPFKHGDS